MTTTDLPRPYRTIRWVKLLFVALVVVSAASIIALFYAHTANNAANHATETTNGLKQQVAQGHDVASQVTTACQTPAQRASLRRLGISCAKASSVAAQPIPATATGARGPGPSSVQIQAAVEIFCAAHAGCTGTPSLAQIRSAVSAYCSGGACTGASGAPGRPGSSGAVGQAGAQGDGPTDDQVLAAVTAYCAAHGDCTGPAGPAGADGKNGADGSSITGPAGPPGPPCPTGYSQATVTPHEGGGDTSYVVCRSDPTTAAPSPTP